MWKKCNSVVQFSLWLGANYPPSAIPVRNPPTHSSDFTTFFLSNYVTNLRQKWFNTFTVDISCWPIFSVCGFESKYYITFLSHQRPVLCLSTSVLQFLQSRVRPDASPVVSPKDPTFSPSEPLPNFLTVCGIIFPKNDSLLRVKYFFPYLRCLLNRQSHPDHFSSQWPTVIISIRSFFSGIQ